MEDDEDNTIGEDYLNKELNKRLERYLKRYFNTK